MTVVINESIWKTCNNFFGTFVNSDSHFFSFLVICYKMESFAIWHYWKDTLKNLISSPIFFCRFCERKYITCNKTKQKKKFKKIMGVSFSVWVQFSEVEELHSGFIIFLSSLFLLRYVLRNWKQWLCICLNWLSLLLNKIKMN